MLLPRLLLAFTLKFLTTISSHTVLGGEKCNQGETGEPEKVTHAIKGASQTSFFRQDREIDSPRSSSQRELTTAYTYTKSISTSLILFSL
jgi:hypothetical protein